MFKITDIKPIIVPKLEELSIKNIRSQTENDVNVREYMPDEYYKKLTPDRSFFFNTINTIYPGFLPSLISGANRQRVDVTNVD